MPTSNESLQQNIDSGYAIGIKVNGVDYKDHTSIAEFSIDTIIGGRVPILRLSISADNLIHYHNLISELTVIELELGRLDEQRTTVEKAKYSFIVSQASSYSADNLYHINIIALADLSNKPSLLGTPVKHNAKQTCYEFLDTLFEDDGTQYNNKFKPLTTITQAGTSKINKLDMLSSKSVDNKTRNISGITKLEAINEVISSSKLQNNTPLGHYFAHNTETGALDLTLFDIVLRTRSFEPKNIKLSGKSVKAEFYYEQYNQGEGITYKNLQLHIKGIDHTAEFWQRSTESYANCEVVRFTTPLDSKAMFKDGMDYPTDNVKVDGSKDITKYNLFRSGLTLQNEKEPTDKEVKIRISDSRAMYLRYTRAVEKINYTLRIKGMLDIKIGDIVKLHIPDFTSARDNIYKEDKLLTGNYMVTRVILVGNSVELETEIVVSRDSYVKGS